MKENAQQLNICFEPRRALSILLNQADFFLQLECHPENDGKFSPQTIALIKAADQLMPPDSLGFMLSSLLPSGYSVSTAEAAKQIAAVTERPVTVTLSGQGRTRHMLKEDAAIAKSQGFVNFFAATGNIAPDHLPDAKGNYAPYPNGYTDSLDILDEIKALDANLCCGVAVNPYKYTPEDQCLQYAKMFRKCHGGAEYIIAQAGWDMKKAQELQWFMQLRELFKPTLGSICLLSQEQAQNLTETYFSGMVFPLPVASALQRHSADARDFEIFQNEMSALQYVGLKCLGYNGVHLKGVNHADQFKAVYEQIQKAQESMASYQIWLEKWQAFHGDVSLGPAPTFHSQGRPHYFFSNLLDPELINYDPKRSLLASASIQTPSFTEKMKAALLRPDASGLAAKLAQRFLERGEERTYGLDNSSCPKRLTVCPCGNSRSDGYCEAGNHPCFFKTVVEISAANNEMNVLED